MAYQIQIHQQPLSLLAIHGPWDDLLIRSASNTIFMSSAWLRATLTAFGGLDRTVIISVNHHQQWVAAIALQVQAHTVRFLGYQMSDYLDILWDQSLTPKAVITCVKLIFEAIISIFPLTQYDLLLPKMRVSCKSPEILAAIPGIYPVTTHILQAPAIEFLPNHTFRQPKNLKKKLADLGKLGTIGHTTYHTSHQVLNKLPQFFAMHRKRWLFSHMPERAMPVGKEIFYQELVQNLAEINALRFNEISLNEKPIAMHFGTFYNNSYSFYTPTFDPDFSQYSAGRLLIDFIIREAAREKAQEFDFLLGDEAYKFERATTCRKLVNLQIFTSNWQAFTAKFKIKAKSHCKKVLQATGQLQTVQRWLKNYQLAK